MNVYRADGSQTSLQMLCVMFVGDWFTFTCRTPVSSHSYGLSCTKGGFVDYMKYVRVGNLIERGHPKRREKKIETHKNNYKIFFKSLCVRVRSAEILADES